MATVQEAMRGYNVNTTHLARIIAQAAIDGMKLDRDKLRLLDNPAENGNGTAYILCSGKGTKRVKVHVGHTDMSIGEVTRMSGPSGYAPQPVTLESLRSSIEWLLGRPV
jgi:hypothetical protein